MLVAIATILFLLLFRLGSLVHGLSESEYTLQQQLAQQSLSGEQILRNPLFLPYYIMMYLMQFSPFHGPTAVRSIGALFGLLGALGFFYILKKWYTGRIAFLGTALLVTSGWFLHTARFASPVSSYLLLPLLIAGVIALQAKARAKWAMLSVIVFGLMALYIPGVIWFIVPALIIQRKTILTALKVQPLWFNIVTATVSAVMLLPLAAMIFWPTANTSMSHSILGLLGLPSSLPTISNVLHAVKDSLGQIFIYNNSGQLYTAGHLAWFDVSTSALFIIGMIQFAKHFGLNRSKIIAIVGSIGFLLHISGGPVPLVILLPFLFLFVVEGLKWLLDVWLAVFPRNPFARSFAVMAVVALVVCVSAYQMSRYYLAWGKAPETRAVFNKLP